MATMQTIETGLGKLSQLYFGDPEPVELSNPREVFIIDEILAELVSKQANLYWALQTGLPAIPCSHPLAITETSFDPLEQMYRYTTDRITVGEMPFWIAQGGSQSATDAEPVEIWPELAAELDGFATQSQIITSRAKDFALGILGRIRALSPTIEPPELIPAGDGSVDIEWDVPGRFISIHVAAEDGGYQSIYQEVDGASSAVEYSRKALDEVLSYFSI